MWLRRGLRQGVCWHEFHAAFGAGSTSSEEVTSGCIGQTYDSGVDSSKLKGTSFMPHLGQVPGSEDVTSGCIGQANDRTRPFGTDGEELHPRTEGTFPAPRT